MSIPEITTRRAEIADLAWSKMFLIMFGSIILGWLLLLDLNFTSDGERYYAYLRSFFFDHDLNFLNEYTLFTFLPSPEKSKYIQTTATGYLWNPFPIGPALEWFPFFLIGHLWSLASNSLGRIVLANGTTLPYLLATAVGTLFYGLVGLWCCVLFLARFFSRSRALWATLVTFWSSPAIAYLYCEPAYAHAMAFAAMSLFLLLWAVFTNDGKVIPSGRQSFVLGVTGGMIFLSRWQDGLIVLFPIVHLMMRGIGNHAAVRRHKSISLGNLVKYGCGVIIPIVPQLVTWKILYGLFFLVPQQQGYFLYWEPLLWKPLFSPLNGLFAWHPFLFFGLIGFSFLWRKNRWICGAAILYFLAELYVNSIISDDRFAVPGFGNRRFITSLPFLAAGVAALTEMVSRRFQRFFAGFSSIVFPVWSLVMMSMYYNGFLSRSEGVSPVRIFSHVTSWWPWVKDMIVDSFIVTTMRKEVAGPSLLDPLLFLLLIAGVVFLLFIILNRLLGTIHAVQPTWTPGILTGLAISWSVYLASITGCLLYSDYRAELVDVVHLGSDAFGKISRLKLFAPERYMGSLSPLHLQPNEAKEIVILPLTDARQIRIVATLSSENKSRTIPETAVSVMLTGKDSDLYRLLFTTPSEIDIMDRAEYQVARLSQPRICASWFNPIKQKLPYHWYMLDKIFQPLKIHAITLKNTTTDCVLHLSGIVLQ